MTNARMTYYDNDEEYEDAKVDIIDKSSHFIKVYDITHRIWS